MLCTVDLMRTSSTSQVEQYCFRAPYITEMLRQGLGISAQQIRIGGGDVAWTLGAHPLAHFWFSIPINCTDLVKGGCHPSSEDSSMVVVTKQKPKAAQ